MFLCFMSFFMIDLTIEEGFKKVEQQLVVVISAAVFV